MVIEIFAGTARVTAELKKFGMSSAFGTDHVRHRQSSAQVVLADLTTDTGVGLLMQWLENEYVIGVFIAPPCGSASRARSIPLKRKKPGDPPAPKPLRSDTHPNGLSGLQFVDRVKVSKANKLYFLTAQLVRWAIAEGCIFCIENPQFSLFWQTSFIQEVIHLMQFTTFQSCMYGSRRPKRTMLGFNAEEFSAINRMCPGVSRSHKHEQWGIHEPTCKFATSLETAYPVPLARTIAAQFVLALQRRGIKMPPLALAELGDQTTIALPVLRAQTGLQPRASKLPPLIPSFSSRVAITGFQDELPGVCLNQKLTSDLDVKAWNAPTILPKGSKLLQLCPPLLPSSCLQGGLLVSEQQLDKAEVDRVVSKCQADLADTTGRAGKCETQVWGIPWTEDDFVSQMVKFGHPSTVKTGLPDVLQDVAKFYSETALQKRVEFRAAKLGFWLNRLVQLKSDEQRLKASMDPDVALILRQKNILLWEQMLQASSYQDMGVVQELRDGTDLVGPVPRTGLWPSKFQPATITLDELHEVSKMERGGLRDQFAGFNDSAIAGEVWRKTLEEVKSGVLEGPLSIDDIDASFPLSRRFGIQQGAKTRCIDDFSRSAINSSVQTCESPKPHTVDVFASMCVHLMMNLDDSDRWVGRTFDLVGAYRQCAVNPSSKRYAHIMVQEPDSGDLVAFRMRALPFGSIRSVHAFLRISHSLWYLLAKEFKVLVTNYFDDFIALSPCPEASSVTSCVHMFFKLLGWAFAETGEKAPEFAAVFQALGVCVHVKELHLGVVEIANTDSRRLELITFLSSVIESRRLTKQEALRLRGRLQFMAGNLFGRIARSCLTAVSTHAYSSTTAAVSDDTLSALVRYRHLLRVGSPRVLKPSSTVPWFIQTDASYEGDGGQVMAGLGAVLFDPSGRPVKFFSHQLSQAVVEKLNPLMRKKTAIFECEFFAVFCAFWLWGSEVTDAVVIYTDNNGVRDTLISCVTRNKVAFQILTATLALESLWQLTPWYARVPTDSNMSDAPSRPSVEKLLKLGATRSRLDGEVCWDELSALCRTWGEEQASC